jgi:hypothetical protein
MMRADVAEVHHYIDYQSIVYYSALEERRRPKSLDEVDPKLWRPTRSWHSLRERERLAGGGGRGV